MLGFLVACILSLGAVGVVQAQEWPTAKPIRLLSGDPPGGLVDQVSRILAEALQIQLKQTVWVENVGGASAAISTAIVAQADPDGYTFAMVFEPDTLNATLKAKNSFDIPKDLSHIAMVGTTPMVLVASKSSGITDLHQLFEVSKAEPPQMYGSVGARSLGYLVMSLLAKNSGFNWRHVPYKAQASLMQDIMGGYISLCIGPLHFMKPYVDGGQVIPLAVTSPFRSRNLPQVPSVSESAYPGFAAIAWWSIVAPTQLSSRIVQRMHKEILLVLKNKAVAEKLGALGIDVVGFSPDQFHNFTEK